jgi:hypothetical protein
MLHHQLLLSILVCSSRTHLGEEGGPDGLDLDLGSRDQGSDLVGGDLDVVIGEDEGGVGGSELGGCHFAARGGRREGQ